MKLTKTAILNKPINIIWQIITDNNNYAWRKDISKINIINELEFEEFTKNNFVTHFKITNLKPTSNYSFSLENKNLFGNWSCFLEELNGLTKLTMIEELTVKNKLLKPIAFVFIKITQNKYVKFLMQELKKY